MHYDPDQPPQVEAEQVRVYHSLLGREMELPADLVVLSTPLVAQEDVEATSQLLRVPIDENGFFLEGHVKLKPLDFATDGVYLCGSAHFPANIREVIAQGLGAASRASIPLAKGSVVVEPIISVLTDEDACRGCGLCVALCPYGALEIRRTEKGRKVHVIDVACSYFFSVTGFQEIPLFAGVHGVDGAAKGLDDVEHGGNASVVVLKKGVQPFS